MSILLLVLSTQGGNDPQTEADRKAQRCIVASLTKRFPGINIQGEEVSLSTTMIIIIFIVVCCSCFVTFRGLLNVNNFQGSFELILLCWCSVSC